MSGRNPSFHAKRLYSTIGALIAVSALACTTRVIAQDSAQSTTQGSCKPALTISEVHFTEMQPPTLSRTWSAVVSVDASHCPANATGASDATGTFDIVFVREKETAPDLEFRERFVWRAPSTKVQIDFAADEAVGGYRIDNVMPCMCGG